MNMRASIEGAFEGSTPMVLASAKPLKEFFADKHMLQIMSAWAVKHKKQEGFEQDGRTHVPLRPKGGHEQALKLFQVLLAEKQGALLDMTPVNANWGLVSWLFATMSKRAVVDFCPNSAA
eukprot:6105436-Amphidinium_carterae.1